LTYGTANGLIDENTKQLTANQRAIILNAIALDDKLNPAIDDFAETSKGLANQQRILKAQFQDALILLGQNLLPIALQVVSALNQLLTAFNQLSPGQQKIILGFLGLLAIAGPLIGIIGKIITIVTTLSSIFGAGGALAGAGTILGTIGTTITAVVIPAIASLAAALAPILIIVGAALALIGLLALMWKTNFLGMRDNWTAGLKFMRNVWLAFTSFLRGDSEEAIAYLQEAWGALVDRFNQIFERLFGIQNAWAKFTEFLRTMLNRTVQYIRDSFSRIDWGQVGKYILLGIANGMLLGLPSLLLMAKKIAEELLAQIKKSLGIGSPSLAAMKLGMYTAQGFQLGLNSVSPIEMARTLTKPITNMNANQQQTIIQNFQSGLTLSTARDEIAKNNEQMMNTFISALS
jgi:hypothetical protein